MKRSDLSAYTVMWLFAMFDLPVETSSDRKNYTKFRNDLLRQGFSMMQYSIYYRFCGNEARARLFKKRLKQNLPPLGDIRFLMVTDRQFGKMETFYGKKPLTPPKIPEQLLLF